MNRLVFLIGSKEFGKDSIVDMVFQGPKKRFPSFKHIRLDDQIEGKISKGFNLASAKKIREAVYEKMEKDIIKNFKNGKSVIIDCSFILKTPKGYLPVVSESFFDAFKPDALILLEFQINKKIPRRIEAIEKLKALEEEQEMNRYYASAYSSLSGALLKVIKIKSDGVRKALKETKEAISFVLGD